MAARAKLEAIHYGVDPRKTHSSKQTVKLPETVSELADRYIEQHLKKNVRRWKTAKGEIECHIRPHLGDLRLDEIERGHVREMLRAIEPIFPVAANRALQRLRALFNWAVQHDFTTVNPTIGIKRPTKEKPKERILSDDELVGVWNACDVLHFPAKEYFRFMILCGQRRDDVRCMRWREIDLENGNWVIPGSRYKNGRAHLVPLTEDMTRLLRELPVKECGGYVFSTTGGKSPYSNLQKPKQILDRNCDIEPWTIHDLRRTLRTGLSRLGTRPDVSERVIGHMVGGILGITYDHYEFRSEKIAALRAWGEHVKSCVKEARLKIS
jgi:integrase